MRAVNLNDLVGEYEQRKEETVKKIMQEKNKGDYYSVLGLPTDCCAEDVRRAFLKLSLLVHPDKNKSPDATEAFKHVLDACERLKKLKLSDTDEEEPISYPTTLMRRSPIPIPTTPPMMMSPTTTPPMRRRSPLPIPVTAQV